MIVSLFLLINAIIILNDFCFKKINNSLNISLLILAIAGILLKVIPWDPFWTPIYFGGSIVLGFLLNAMGLMGGGDVKFIAASSLWAGPEHGVTLFIFTSIIGGVLTVFYLIKWGKFMGAIENFVRGIWLKIAPRFLIPEYSIETFIGGVEQTSGNYQTKRKKILVPYGIAIAIASILIVLSRPWG